MYVHCVCVSELLKYNININEQYFAVFFHYMSDTIFFHFFDNDNDFYDNFGCTFHNMSDHYFVSF